MTDGIWLAVALAVVCWAMVGIVVGYAYVYYRDECLAEREESSYGWRDYLVFGLCGPFWWLVSVAWLCNEGIRRLAGWATRAGRKGRVPRAGNVEGSKGKGV